MSLRLRLVDAKRMGSKAPFADFDTVLAQRLIGHLEGVALREAPAALRRDHRAALVQVLGQHLVHLRPAAGHAPDQRAHRLGHPQHGQDEVRVVDGPFANFNGMVDEVIPEKGKVRVLVSIFGRSTPVELDFVQVNRV